MPTRNINAKGRRNGPTFVAFPHALLDSAAFKSLSPAAVKLLLDLASQYRGTNNGDLALTFSTMRGRGWRSTATLNRAKRELLDAGLIELTRQGGLAQGRRIPSLYALTWQPINECKDGNGRHKLDVSPTKVASGRWKTNARIKK